MTKEASLRSEREENADPISNGGTMKETRNQEESIGPPPLIDVVFIYISYAFYVILGFIADFRRRLGFKRDHEHGFLAARDVSVYVVVISTLPWKTGRGRGICPW